MTVTPAHASGQVKLRVNNSNLFRFAGGENEITLRPNESVQYVDVYGANVFFSSEPRGIGTIIANVNPDVGSGAIRIFSIEDLSSDKLHELAQDGIKGLAGAAASEIFSGAKKELENLRDDLTPAEEIRLDLTLSLLNENKAKIENQTQDVLVSFANAWIGGRFNVSPTSNMDSFNLSQFGVADGEASSDYQDFEFKLFPRLRQEAFDLLKNFIVVGGTDFEQKVESFILKPAPFLDGIKLFEAKWEVTDPSPVAAKGRLRIIAGTDGEIRWNEDAEWNNPTFNLNAWIRNLPFTRGNQFPSYEFRAGIGVSASKEDIGVSGKIEFIIRY